MTAQAISCESTTGFFGERIVSRRVKGRVLTRGCECASAILSARIELVIQDPEQREEMWAEMEDILDEDARKNAEMVRSNASVSVEKRERPKGRLAAMLHIN